MKCPYCEWEGPLSEFEKHYSDAGHGENGENSKMFNREKDIVIKDVQSMLIESKDKMSVSVMQKNRVKAETFNNVEEVRLEYAADISITAASALPQKKSRITADFEVFDELVKCTVLASDNGKTIVCGVSPVEKIYPEITLLRK